MHWTIVYSPYCSMTYETGFHRLVAPTVFEAVEAAWNEFLEDIEFCEAGNVE